MLRVETEFVQSDIKYSVWTEDHILGVTTEGDNPERKGQFTCWRITRDGTLEEVAVFATQSGATRLAESSAHAQVLATAHLDPTVRIWNTAAPLEPLQRLLFHRADVEDVRWSPFDSHELVTAGKDGQVAVWALGALDPLWSHSSPDGLPFVAAQLHPQRPLLLFAAPLDGRVQAVHARERRPVFALDGADDPLISALALDAYDEHVLRLGAESGRLLEWDLRSPAAPLSRARVHRGAVTALVPEPHGPGVWSAAQDGWVARDGRPVWRAHRTPCTALDASVHRCGRVVSAGADLALALCHLPPVAEAAAAAESTTPDEHGP